MGPIVYLGQVAPANVSFLGQVAPADAGILSIVEQVALANGGLLRSKKWILAWQETHIGKIDIQRRFTTCRPSLHRECSLHYTGMVQIGFGCLVKGSEL